MRGSGSPLGLFLSRLFEPEVQAWHGLCPLWKVFWFRGVLASSAIIAVYLNALAYHEISIQHAVLMFFIAYTFLIIVSIWRCSEGSTSYWRGISRSVSIFWAINALLLVVFLEIDLFTGSRAL